MKSYSKETSLFCQILTILSKTRLKFHFLSRELVLSDCFDLLISGFFENIAKENKELDIFFGNLAIFDSFGSFIGISSRYIIEDDRNLFDSFSTLLSTRL